MEPVSLNTNSAIRDGVGPWAMQLDGRAKRAYSRLRTRIGRLNCLPLSAVAFLFGLLVILVSGFVLWFRNLFSPTAGDAARLGHDIAFAVVVLTLVLEFMAIGLINGRNDRDFFHSHVHSWQPRAAQRTIEAQVSPFYADLARLLIKFLASENRFFATDAPAEAILAHTPSA